MAKINLNELISTTNISDVVGKYVDLTKKGKNFVGICPFHEDTNPSMSVSNEKRMFKCFVCGVGGNAVNFVAEKEEVSFGKALNLVASQLGIEIKNNFISKPKYSPKQKLLINALNDANNFFRVNLDTDKASAAGKYLLKDRKLTEKQLELHNIGFSSDDDDLFNFLVNKGHDPSILINASLITSNNKPFFKNRIIFAITNEFGDVIGFSGRSMTSDGPKYINSSDSLVFDKSNILYNMSLASDSINKHGEVVIVEGFMDAIALNKIGVKNAVAVMGTALTEKHLQQIKYKTPILMFDSDKAGLLATKKSINILEKENFKTKVVINKTGLDPDSLLNDKGKEALKDILTNQRDVSEFMYAILKKEINPSTPSKIEGFVAEFSKYLKNGSLLEKKYFASKAAKDFKISEDAFMSVFPKTPLVNESKSSSQNEPKREFTALEKYNYWKMKEGTRLMNEMYSRKIHLDDFDDILNLKWIAEASRKYDTHMQNHFKIPIPDHKWHWDKKYVPLSAEENKLRIESAKKENVYLTKELVDLGILDNNIPKDKIKMILEGKKNPTR